MDSTITADNLFNNASNGNDDGQTHQRASRSVSHGRPPSASGVRTKIPMNINHSRPTSSIINPETNVCTQDDSANSAISGIATRRLTRSHNSALLKSKGQVVAPSGMQKRWLESQFKKERKRYLSITKELNEKEKCAQQLYDDVSQLREKLIANGGKDPGKIEKLNLNFNHSNKQSGDQNICRGGEEINLAISPIINQEFVAIIQNELRNCPQDYLILCEDALQKHAELLKWIEIIQKPNEKLSNEVIEHMESFQKDMAILNDRMKSEKKHLEEFDITIIKKVMSMWTEIQALRSRVRQLEAIGSDTINEWRMKFDSETDKLQQLNEIKTTVENELIKSKAKVQTLESRVDNDETKIVQLQSHIKNLEIQLKQKDINFENNTRDLHKSLKHSEETIVSLENEKDNLQARLSEMKVKLETEEKRLTDKSPSVQEVTKCPIEDNKLRDRDTKRKVGELETLVETLRQEVTCNKDLIIKLQNEKSSSEIQLKEQLAKEQAQTTKLMENYEQLKKEHESIKQKTRDGQIQLLYNCDTTNNKKESESIEFAQLTETQRQEIVDLKRKNKDLEAQLQEQIKNLELKNEMIVYLKGGHLNENEHNNDRQINKEIDLKAEALQELYSTLEKKQMQLTHLENVLKQMEGQEMRNQEQRTRYEKRIAQLEYDVQMKKNKDCRYVYPTPHSSSKQNEIEKILELERKYQRLKKESWQMETIYNKLMDTTLRTVKSREIMRHSHGSCRDREHVYRSSIAPRRADVGCYVHQVVDQCGRELGGAFSSSSRQRVRCWGRSPHRIMRRDISSKKECIGHIHQ